MSAIKRWLEDHISEITDEELLEDGYEQKEIDFMREFSSCSMRSLPGIR